ncbi:MAG: triphosphoribosyl-dephospho-CoA synthase [Negativicutes bacterium]|nr:triphosphoribosyl-dephospho-CoA synthase [Negativicutes bacterium]
MTDADFRRDIAWAGTAACLLEAAAPKAGNVNRLYDFADCLLEDFLLSAAVIGEPLGRAGGRGVGETVVEAITKTRDLIPANTNLGIILLLVPMAKAWSQVMPAAGRAQPTAAKHGIRLALKGELDKVLADLAVEDARLVYQAVRLAAPGGLGHPGDGDVYREDRVDITLLQAMGLAAERDLIAREYVSGYQIILETGVPMLEQTLRRGLPFSQAVAHSQLYLLSQYSDTLIARKAGLAASEEVRTRAGTVWERGGWCSPDGRAAAAEFDRWLRRCGNRFNPGTTADLVTAMIFLLLLENGPELWRQSRQPAKSRQWNGGEGNGR